MKTKDLFKR